MLKTYRVIILIVEKKLVRMYQKYESGMAYKALVYVNDFTSSQF